MEMAPAAPFRCGMCEEIIPADAAVYMRRDRAFCGEGCRQQFPVHTRPPAKQTLRPARRGSFAEFSLLTGIAPLEEESLVGEELSTPAAETWDSPQICSPGSIQALINKVYVMEATSLISGRTGVSHELGQADTEAQHEEGLRGELPAWLALLSRNEFCVDNRFSDASTTCSDSDR